MAATSLVILSFYALCRRYEWFALPARRRWRQLCMLASQLRVKLRICVSFCQVHSRYLRP